MSLDAMKQALEALEAEAAGWDSVSPVTRDAIIALLAAIEHAERPMTHSADCWRWHHACARAWIERNKPTAPRQWQGLTDEEIQAAWASMNHDPAAFVHFAGGALWAEAKMKEKNG
jgi:hypothetical protein